MNNRGISWDRLLIFFVLIIFLCSAFFIINAIALTGQAKNIKLALEYKSGTIFDPNDDGIEPIGNLIDLTVENSEFNWGVDYNKICTKWDISSNNKRRTFCFGSEECCRSIKLFSISGNWNDVLYADYGIYDVGYDSSVSAQIFYVGDNAGSEEAIYSDVKSLDVHFIGNANPDSLSLSSSNSQPTSIQGATVYTQNSPISFNEIKDCKTRYWEAEEPVYETCKQEYAKTICDDPPINKTCHDEILYYNYTCQTGTQTIQKSEETCNPKELRITRNNEEGIIDFGNWGKCSTKEDAGALTIICDSRYDGNNDGICQSGESCVKFVITKDDVQRYLKNSQDEFTAEDESFFLEKLNYEVLRNEISGTSSDKSSEVMEE